MRSADLLFLPMQKLPLGRRSSTVPGKTYEYLASGRPILGAVPPGDARDLLEQAGHHVCDPDDADAIASAIGSALVPASEQPADHALTRRYSYENLAVEVASVIEAAITGQKERVVPLPRPMTARERDVKVLMIAYHFPPIGGAGAQRSLKFARYLPECGCQPTVVTGPGSNRGRWTPADPTLSHEVPEEVRVLRVPGPEPETPGRLLGRLRRWLRLQSVWSDWWIAGVRAAAAAAGDPDVVLSSSSPYDTAEAAARLARALGKPWVAGLRDPWALDEMVVYPSRVHRWLEQRRMRRLLGSAAAIVMNTPEAARQLLEAFPELGDRPVVAIPNGYDAADFAGEAPARDPERFRIVHTGYLHTELGLQQRRLALLRRLLGGGSPGVEILPRSHVYLLRAVEQLLERDPSLQERLELHFAGVLSETDRALAAQCPVAVLHGYVPHAESIALMRSADLLFLPMQKLPLGRRSSTVPGKTYEYLASGRPILGAVPPGDARDLLEQAGHHVCDPDDADAIAERIADALERHDRRDPRPLDQEPIDCFERRVLARGLADLLEGVADVAPRPAAPAAIQG
jgi:glycosyltransferase involved in cell wall biosynthesis